MNKLASPFIVTDASVYDIKPNQVFEPGDAPELLSIITNAINDKRSITLRAGGTSLGGQAIGPDIVIDISRYFTKILSINAQRKEAIVEPGVILDDLNTQLTPMGLQFAPDNSTSNRAMIGGMIGNNSCGSYSVFYGTTREHVKSVDVILADGSEVTFSELSSNQLEKKLKQTDFEGYIYREVVSLLSKHGKEIVSSFPDSEIKRRNTGYALDVLFTRYQPFNPDGLPFNLTPLICGSEGTLAVIKQARLNLVSRPEYRGLICGHFNSIQIALKKVPGILGLEAVAIEIIDKATLDCTKGNLQQSLNRFWIKEDPEAVLVIEIFDKNESRVNERLRVIRDWLLNNEAYAAPIIDQIDSVKVWNVRKAGLGLLMGKISRKKAVAVIEDAAVPVNKLAQYYLDVKALMSRLEVNCVYYGHASVGLIHIRPELDLAVEQDRKLFKNIAEEHSLLVKKYRGAISGEHGDGRIRAPYIKSQVGESVYKYLVKLKEIFDPEYLLNPGVIIGSQSITENLRAYRKQQVPIETGFNWEKDISLLDAVEKCNGAGVCRKSSGNGVMCPSYQVTRNENYSTRGRSNLLRHALTEIKLIEALKGEALQKAFSLCLGCKACKSECPASVDMARLKSEMLYQVKKKLSLTNIMIKHYGRMLRFISKVPRLGNVVQNTSIFKRLLGVDPRRKLPQIIRQKDGLIEWWAENFESQKEAVNTVKVWVICDLYSQYFEPEVGRSVLQSLERTGLSINPVFIKNSPRSLISQGLLDEAKNSLMEVIGQLEGIKEDDLIVGIEPSEVLVWRDEAKDLLPERVWECFGNIQILLYEELMLQLSNLGLLPELSKLDKKLKLHVHCHQKSLAKAEHAIQALELIPGLEIELLNVGCCGMSGDFGYKHFDLSREIAEKQLLPAISSMDNELLVATGTSCRHQVADFSVKKGLHPAQVFLEVI